MDLVDRLYRRLREAAVRQYPATGTPSFTIGELYQQLVPYRGVRGDLGILELAEYEHALLRLLSGERGYLRVEDAQVQEELSKELSAPNPILGIYRDYASVRVELPPVVEAPTVPERPHAAPPPLEVSPTRQTPPVPAPSRPTARPSCHSCRAPLPADPDLRFCPHCGTDQSEVSCAQCGLTLKPEWNFCIRCGTRRAGP